MRSLGTEDGGYAGVLMEVTMAVAARLITEGRATAVTAEEAAQYRAEVRYRWENTEPVVVPAYRPVAPNRFLRR